MNTKERSLKRKNEWIGRIFVLPFVIGFILFYLKPIIESLSYAFTDIKFDSGGIIKKFVGFDNFKYLFFEDATFLRMLSEALKSLLYQVPVIVIFSLFIAILLNQKFKGRSFARALFFMPVIISSSVVMDILMNDIFIKANSGGGGSIMISADISASVLFDMLLSIGLPFNMVQQIVMTAYSLFSQLWFIGVQILIFLAGLQSIPESFYEASKMEGATSWESFWKITFPMVSPIILVNVVYTIIDSFMNFTNPVMRMISKEMSAIHFSLAAAMSWIHFITVIIVLGVVFKILSKKVFYQVQ